MRTILKRTAQGAGILGVCAGGYYAAQKYYHHYRKKVILSLIQNLERKPNPPSREEQLQSLKTKEFDLLVVGGGATGCGVALDAATRGLRVALVERDDFGAGTSTRSTKLIHGGVRYLENAIKHFDYGQYQLVKEALTERSLFLRNAPHVTHLLPIMIPIYKWYMLPYYWAGAKLYDLVAGYENLESSYYLNKSKALTEFPMLREDKLQGAIVYYDGQQNDARTNIMLACTAASFGATVANHVEVTQLVKDPATQKVRGALVKDAITGEQWTINAKGVINACGPFSDTLRKMDDSGVEDIVVPSAGVHVVLPNYYSPQNMGLLDPATSDGRVIFFLPWNNNTLAGTTDSQIELTATPKPTELEIHWILQEISNYLSPDLCVQRGDVLAAWSGIRPLVRDPNQKDTKSLSRSHVIEVSKNSLITIAGGKWTTYRRMAEDTVDRAIQVLGLMPKVPHSLTEGIKINGGENYTPTSFIKLIQQYGIDRRVAIHLVNSYGDRAFEVAQLGRPTGLRWPVVGVRLSPVYFYIDAEIRYTIKREYATTLVDVIARRTPLAFQNANSALDALPVIAEIMSEELGWDAERKNREFSDAVRYLGTMGIDSESKSVRQNFTSLEVVRWRKIFGKLDKKHEGMVSLGDVEQELSEIYPKEQLHEILQQFSSSDRLDFSQFLEVMTISKHDENLPPVKKLLGAPDVDRSGGGV